MHYSSFKRPFSIYAGICVILCFPESVIIHIPAFKEFKTQTTEHFLGFSGPLIGVVNNVYRSAHGESAVQGGNGN